MPWSTNPKCGLEEDEWHNLTPAEQEGSETSTPYSSTGCKPPLDLSRLRARGHNLVRRCPAFGRGFVVLLWRFQE